MSAYHHVKFIVGIVFAAFASSGAAAATAHATTIAIDFDGLAGGTAITIDHV